MRCGPDKVIVYLNGVLCAMDREATIAIPFSRWKLVEIGLACFLVALKGNGAAAPRSLEPVDPPEAALDAHHPAPEALAELPREAEHLPWVLAGQQRPTNTESTCRT